MDGVVLEFLSSDDLAMGLGVPPPDRSEDCAQSIATIEQQRPISPPPLYTMRR